MTLLRSLVEGRRGPESRAAALPNTLKALLDARGFTSWAGVTVTERRALQQITVYSCVSLIADTISTLPVAAFRKIGDAPDRVTPDPQILQAPNAEMDLPEWLGRDGVSLLLRGNGINRVIERDSMGFPRQLLPLHPDDAVPFRNGRGEKVWKITGESRPVPDFDVLHLKGMTLPGPQNLLGLSPLEYALQSIGTSLAADEFGSRFFADGGFPSSVLVATGKNRDGNPVKISDDDADDIAERWVETYGGRSRRPAVLSGGLDWKPVELKPSETQFLDLIEAKRGEICGLYRVPPHMISDVERSTSWGTGIEEQSLGFVTFTLTPWIQRFERALTRVLPKPQYVKFNVAGLLRGRTLDRFQAYLLARQGGWLNVDEIRAMEERGRVPDGSGQTFSQPLNWGPLPQPGQPADASSSPSSDGNGFGGSNGPAAEAERVARILEGMELVTQGRS